MLCPLQARKESMGDKQNIIKASIRLGYKMSFIVCAYSSGLG